MIPFDHNIRSAAGKSSEKEIKVQQLVQGGHRQRLHAGQDCQISSPQMQRILPGNRSATSSLRRAGRKFNLLEVGFELVLEPGLRARTMPESLIYGLLSIFISVSCHGGLVHNDYTIAGLSNSQHSQLSCVYVPHDAQGGPLRYEQLSQPPKVNDSIKKEGMKPTIPPVAWRLNPWWIRMWKHTAWFSMHSITK